MKRLFSVYSEERTWATGGGRCWRKTKGKSDCFPPSESVRAVLSHVRRKLMKAGACGLWWEALQMLDETFGTNMLLFVLKASFTCQASLWYLERTCLVLGSWELRSLGALDPRLTPCGQGPLAWRVGCSGEDCVPVAVMNGWIPGECSGHYSQFCGKNGWWLLQGNLLSCIREWVPSSWAF